MLSSFFNTKSGPPGSGAAPALPPLPHTLQPTEHYMRWRLKTARRSMWMSALVTLAVVAWPAGSAMLNIWNGGDLKWPPLHLLLPWVVAMLVVLAWPFLWFSGWRIKPLLDLEPDLIAEEGGLRLVSRDPRKSFGPVPWADVWASPRFLLVGSELLRWRAQVRRSTEEEPADPAQVQPMYAEEEIAHVIVARIPVARQRLDADLILAHKSR